MGDIALQFKDRSRTSTLPQKRRACTAGLAACIFSGGLLWVVGWCLSGEVSLGILGRSWSTVASGLIALFFPLMMLAAHCIDKGDGLNKRAFRKSFSRHRGHGKNEFCLNVSEVTAEN